VKAYLDGRRDLDSMNAQLNATAARANEVFQRAAWAERDATLADSLSDIPVGEVLSAIVVSRTRNGCRVRLERPGVIATLPGNRRPGERLRVEVVKVDPYAGRVDLKPASGK
jgi:exoribonuclease R